MKKSRMNNNNIYYSMVGKNKNVKNKKSRFTEYCQGISLWSGKGHERRMPIKTE